MPAGTVMTFSDWNRLSREDPEAAVDTLVRSIDSIPKKIRSAVFSHLLERETLQAHFIDSITQSDGPLAGVPFLLKDLFDVPGYATKASSQFLAEVRGVPEAEAALSLDARRQGAVFAGKTHLNEFAYGLSGENEYYGDCPHPFKDGALSGGSSSGSAWAVAKGIVPLAFGTDTGGSIRVPAAWCGLFGLRLSPNAWSRDGCFPLAPSFDTAGWFCSNAADMATSIRSLIGPPTREASLDGLKGLNLTDPSLLEKSPFRNQFSDTIEKLGAQSQPDLGKVFREATTEAPKHFSVLQSSEALEVHRPWLDERKHQYDAGVWERIARARRWSDQDRALANEGEAKIKEFFETAFKEFDFLVLPASWTPAVGRDDHSDVMRNQLLQLTSPGSLARCPILTIPVRNESNETSGLQILYKDWRSDLPLRVLEML